MITTDGFELEAISECLVEQRGTKLGLDELLGYLHAAIAAAPGALLSAGRPLAGLVADVALGDGRVAVAMARAADAAIADHIAAICRRIADAYGAALGRRPSLDELLDGFAAALAADARRLIDVPAAARVTAIRATAERPVHEGARWRRLAVGDVFSIGLRDVGYVTGHVVHVDHDGALVDVYGPPSPEPEPDADALLLRGVTVARARPRGAWRVFGHRPIGEAMLAASA